MCIRDSYIALCTGLEKDMETNRSKVAEIGREYKESEGALNNLRETEADAYEKGIRKFGDQSKSKSPETIIANFSPHTLGLENTVNKLTDVLKDQQREYCSLYDCDFGTGREAMEEYLKDQLKRIGENRSVRFFSGDFEELERILMAVIVVSFLVVLVIK